MKARYGLNVGSGWEMAQNAFNIPVSVGLGYYQGTQIGQGLGFDEQSQRRLGNMNAFNSGLSATSTFFNSLQQRRETKNRQAELQAMEYVTQPYDRYAYNSNLGGPRQGNFYQAGGLISPTMQRETTSLNRAIPNQDLLFTKERNVTPTVMDRATDWLGITNYKPYYDKLNVGIDTYNAGVTPYLGKSKLSVYNMKKGGCVTYKRKMQDGGEVDFYDQMPEEVVFDATPQTSYQEPIESSSAPRPRFSQPTPGVNAPKGGSIAVSHNNPGNIKFGSFASGFGAVPGRKATDGGVFAMFPDVETGLSAQRRLLVGKNYRNLTVADAMKRWSNNGYGGELYPAVANKTMGQLTEAELVELQKRQIKREDGNMFRMIYGQ